MSQWGRTSPNWIIQMICKWARWRSESRLAPLESSKQSVDLLFSFSRLQWHLVAVSSLMQNQPAPMLMTCKWRHFTSLTTFEVFRPLSATKVGGSRDCRPPIAANRFVIFDRNKMAAVTNSLKLINEVRVKKEEDRVMRTSPLISHLIDSSIF